MDVLVMCQCKNPIIFEENTQKIYNHGRIHAYDPIMEELVLLTKKAYKRFGVNSISFIELNKYCKTNSRKNYGNSRNSFHSLYKETQYNSWEWSTEEGDGKMRPNSFNYIYDMYCPTIGLLWDDGKNIKDEPYPYSMWTYIIISCWFALKEGGSVIVNTIGYSEDEEKNNASSVSTSNTNNSWNAPSYTFQLNKIKDIIIPTILENYSMTDFINWNVEIKKQRDLPLILSNDDYTFSGINLDSYVFVLTKPFTHKKNKRKTRKVKQRTFRH